MQLIDGKATANAIKEQIAEEVAQIVANGGKQPHLAAVLVGHDGGSETYVKNKVLACEKCGFKSTLIRYEDDVTEEELLACVDKLNKDEALHGAAGCLAIQLLRQLLGDGGASSGIGLSHESSLHDGSAQGTEVDA